MESDREPGDSEEIHAQKRIVRITADLLETAAEVIRETQKRDGREFDQDEPSLVEMAGIANLIITGKISGIYAETKDEPKKSILDPGSLHKLVESMVRLELLKQRSVAVPQVPPRVPIRCTTCSGPMNRTLEGIYYCEYCKR